MYGHTLSQEPLPKGSCTEEVCKRNNAFSLYDHKWPHPITGTPAPGVMKFTILVKACVLIITLY